ncbi:kelch-like protein 10 [Leptotrombidium deliense]|uniref:Kelch-like protein diablo n=1 Tax=Leptotrombidium deliense TaxID=299467 RepID=A0A443SAZ0_9ACAR|nr:kelch-like protein 10 [Leptotrombidium deliense]
MSATKESCVSKDEKRKATNWELMSDRSNTIKELKKSNKFVDALLITNDGGRELVHISVLSTLGSKLTETMLSATECETIEVNGITKRVKKIVIPNMSKNALKVLVDCAYSGVISSDVKGIYELLTAAQEYEMADVIKACCTYFIFQINIDNCVQLLHLGIKHGHKLRTAAWNMIRSNFHTVVEKSSDFASLTFEQLCTLLEDDKLSIENEETAWIAIRRWVKTDITVRVKLLPNLLKCLRYARMKTAFLREVILTDTLLEKSAEAKDILQRMIKANNEENMKRKVDGYGLPINCEVKHMKPRIPDEIIFAIGGWLEGVPTTLVETYDIRTNRWFESKISHQFPRAYHGIQILHGIIYIVGGTNGQEILSTLHCYDPSSGKWHQRANMYEQRCYVSTAILNHEIYAMGGHNGIQRVRTVEKYDHKTNQWHKVEDMNLARSDASATVYQHKIYIAGGLNEQVIENSVEFYNFEDKTWSFIQPMNFPRTSLVLLTYKDCLYALGGNNGFERLSSVERYDFKSSSWTPVQNMNSRRSTFSGCVIEEKIVVVGGYNGHTPINKVEMYDETNKQWTPMKNIKHDRSGLAVCVLKGLSNSCDFTYFGQKSKKEKSLIKKRI